MSDSIHALMSRVMKDITAIGKTQRNEHFNYSFRGVDDVFNALYGPLTKHGVFYIPTVIKESHEHNGKQWRAVVTVCYRFYGPNGDYVEATTVGEGLDSSDKASNKAMVSALKYMLLHTFCIPTEEQRRDDPDGHAEQYEASRGSGGAPTNSKAHMGSGELTFAPSGQAPPSQSTQPAPKVVAAGGASHFALIQQAVADGRVSRVKALRTARYVADELNLDPPGSYSDLANAPGQLLQATIEKLELA